MKHKKNKNITYKKQGGKKLNHMRHIKHLLSSKNYDDIEQKIDNIGEKIADNASINELIDNIGSSSVIGALSGGGPTDPNNYNGPTYIDKMIEGVGENTTGISDKIENIINYPSELLNKFGNYGSKMFSILEALIARGVIKAAGIDNTNVEKVAEELVEDSKKLNKVVEFLDTEKGKEMLENMNSIADKGTEIVSNATENLVSKIDEPLNEITEKATQSAVNAVGAIPGVGTITNSIKVADNLTGLADSAAELATTTTNTINNAVNEIGQPINEAIDETKNIVNEANKITQQPILAETKIDQIEQSGGGNTNIQYGGKYIRKRVSSTRHAFRKISKHVTRKNIQK